VRLMELEGRDSRAARRSRGTERELRFDLRFEAGHARLRLAEPLIGRAFRVDALELDLGRIPGGLDLSAGFDRLRRRRSRLRSLEARVLVGDLRSWWRREYGVDLEITEGHRPGAFGLAVEDLAGVVAAEVEALPVGRAVRLLFSDVRASRDGAETPWKRLLDMGRIVGLRFEEYEGVFRWEDPMWGMLARALVRFGWRVPDVRGVVLARPEWEDGEIKLRCDTTSTEGDAETKLDLYRLEESRVAAPAMSALAQGQAEVAYQAVSEECVRLREAGDDAGPSAERMSALALSLQGELPGRERSVLDALDSTPGLRPSTAETLRVRLASRGDDPDAMVSAVRRLLEVEPATLLAVDAARVVAERVLESRPIVADDLVRRAMARAPTDPRLLLLRARTVACLRDRDGLARLGRMAGRAKLSDAERARVFAAVGVAFIRLDDVAESRLMIEQAEALAPNAVSTLEALALLHERDGDVARAVSRLDRAAERMRGEGEPRESARLLLRAARMLMAEGSEALAEARLEQAVSLDAAASEVVVTLAELRRGMGAENATIDAYASLLELERHDPAWRDALIQGARYHLANMRDMEAASPFLEKLIRVFPANEEVLALQVEMAAFAANDWLEDPDRLAGADGDLLERIVRDAASPEQAVRALMEAVRTREGRGEMVSSALARAKRGLVSGAKAAGKRGKDSGLVGRVASVLVKLEMLPQDKKALTELAEHADNDEVRERIEAARDKLEE